jgi:hypothetical protein
MLRKFPPQTGFSKPQQFNGGMPPQMLMPQMMHGGFPQQQFNMQQGIGMQMPMQMHDISSMDPATKREYLGENLFGKITSNPNFANISE